MLQSYEAYTNESEKIEGAQAFLNRGGRGRLPLASLLYNMQSGREGGSMGGGGGGVPPPPLQLAKRHLSRNMLLVIQ